jgi:phosphoribosylformylglycinamidine (FGAM) synthase PurS component
MNQSKLSSIISSLFIVGCASAPTTSDKDLRSEAVSFFCKNKDAAEEFFLHDGPLTRTPTAYLELRENRNQLLYRDTDSKGNTLLMCYLDSREVDSFDKYYVPQKIDYLLKNKSGKDIYSLVAQNDSGKARVLFGNQQNESERIYSKYCSEKRQIKRMRTKIDVTIDSLKKNIPLDVLSKDRSEKSRKAREMINNLLTNEAIESFEWEDKHPGKTASSREASLWNSGKEINGVSFFSNKMKIESVTPSNISGLEDLSILVNYFTFNIPANVQKIAFKKKTFDEPLPDSKCEGFDSASLTEVDRHGLGFVGLDENCRFLPSKALADRARAWSYISRRFVKVQESVGNNTNDLVFEYEVDLSPLCVYGVSTSNLVSK